MELLQNGHKCTKLLLNISITGEKDHDKAIAYGKEWLKSIGEESATMTQNECQFCHSQGAPAPVEEAIKANGYFIQKMEGCP
jgi:hypothetical protein